MIENGIMIAIGIMNGIENAIETYESLQVVNVEIEAQVEIAAIRRVVNEIMNHGETKN